MIIEKRDSSKLELISWFPGVKKFISLQQLEYYINEMKIILEACVDGKAFQIQQILGYYVHRVSKPISNPISDRFNPIECFKTTHIVKDDELALLPVSHHPTETDYVPLNSLLNRSDQCYLVIRLQSDPDKDVFKNIFELDIDDLRSYGFNIMYQIYSFLKLYHDKTVNGERLAYGPFLSKIDNDGASIRVHQTFYRNDSFNNVRAKFWFKSKLFHDLKSSTQRTVDNDLSDFCLLANRIMFRIFEEEYPVGGKTYPDWSRLDERIRQVTRRDESLTVHSKIWEQKESIFAFLIICKKLQTDDFSRTEFCLENRFNEFEGKTYNMQIEILLADRFVL